MERKKSYQLDALEAYVPDEFRRIVQQPIDTLFDKTIREKVLEQHSAEKYRQSN